MLKDEIYVFDLETTGLEPYPINIPVEIAIWKIQRNLEIKHVFDSLILWPSKFEKLINNSWWSGESGIEYRHLLDSPTIEQIWPKIKAILSKKNTTSWNTAYDIDRFIRQMERVYGRIPYIRLPCPMITATPIVGIENYYGYKWPTLNEAANYYQIDLETNNFHRANFDTQMTAAIIVEMIKRGEYLV